MFQECKGPFLLTMTLKKKTLDDNNNLLKVSSQIQQINVGSKV